MMMVSYFATLDIACLFDFDRSENKRRQSFLTRNGKVSLKKIRVCLCPQALLINKIFPKVGQQELGFQLKIDTTKSNKQSVVMDHQSTIRTLLFCLYLCSLVRFCNFLYFFGFRAQRPTLVNSGRKPKEARTHVGQNTPNTQRCDRVLFTANGLSLAVHSKPVPIKIQPT